MEESHRVLKIESYLYTGIYRIGRDFSVLAQHSPARDKPRQIRIRLKATSVIFRTKRVADKGSAGLAAKTLQDEAISRKSLIL